MSGDYSRKHFNPQKHYQGVLRQQGRPDLDADSNENVDAQDRRWRAETIDVIGQCGVSSQTPDGFKIQGLASQLMVGPGRFYVDGYLAENHGAQPRFNPILEELYGVAPLPGPDLPERRSLVYLDVWRREVTHLQDPELIEPALDVDTTTRHQTAWQVRILPLNPNATITCQTPLADVPGWVTKHSPSTARLTTSTVAVAAESDPCLVPPTGGYRGLENHFYRIEIHRVTGTTVSVKWSRENAHVATRVVNIEHAGSTTTLQVESLGRDETLSFLNSSWIEIMSDSDEFSGTSGIMRQITTLDPTTQKFSVDGLDSSIYPDGLVDADQHLRVVRWDQVGIDLTSEGLIELTPANPSFVLEHGIKATLEGLAGARVGDYWCFAARTAVADIEPLDHAPPHGIHHHFCKLAIIESDGTIHDCRPQFPTLTELKSLFYLSGDGQEASAGMPLPRPLQVGVANGGQAVIGAMVQFEVTAGGGTLQESAASSLVVVTGADGVASCTWKLGSAMASQQVLARLLDGTGGSLHLPVRFNATLGLSGLEAGVHVKRVSLIQGESLENDSLVPVNRFSQGLAILCDQIIEPDTINNRPTCFVTVDLPYPTEADKELRVSPIIGYLPMRLAANAVTNQEMIMWTPEKFTQSWLETELIPMMGKQEPGTRVLAHLTLLGNFIWQVGKPEVCIDGDLFGMREKPGDVFPTAGRWPTGDGRRGGNLHMWFWLTPPEEVTISIQPARPVKVQAGGQKNFTVTVTGTENPAVRFEPIPRGLGQILPALDKERVWTYHAPSFVPELKTVSLTAWSVADPNQRVTALVTLLRGGTRPTDKVTVTIKPKEAKLGPKGERNFTVSVEGAVDPTVDVFLAPPSFGTLTLINKSESRWTYKAPDAVKKNTIETIIARSRESPKNQAMAKISILRSLGGPQSPGKPVKPAPKKPRSGTKPSGPKRRKKTSS